jgi:hypothetical protein
VVSQRIIHHMWYSDNRCLDKCFYRMQNLCKNYANLCRGVAFPGMQNGMFVFVAVSVRFTCRMLRTLLLHIRILIQPIYIISKPGYVFIIMIINARAFLTFTFHKTIHPYLYYYKTRVRFYRFDNKSAETFSAHTTFRPRYLYKCKEGRLIKDSPLSQFMAFKWLIFTCLRKGKMVLDAINGKALISYINIHLCRVYVNIICDIFYFIFIYRFCLYEGGVVMDGMILFTVDLSFIPIYAFLFQECLQTGVYYYRLNVCSVACASQYIFNRTKCALRKGMKRCS